MTITQLLFKTSLFAFMLSPMSGCAKTSSSVPEFKEFIKKAKNGKPIVIAYLGGSITFGEITSPVSGTNSINKFYNFTNYNPEKDSWRAKTFEWLRNKFEQKKGQFQQINAAIGGTSSLLGAYRLEQDLLSQKPDLVFVEFAVNDNEMARLTLNNPNAPRSILRTTKSIIERLRKQNPNVAIFMPLSTHRILKKSVHNPWAEILDLGHDQTLLSAESMRVPYISLKKEFYNNHNKKSMTHFFDGPDSPGNYVHPSPKGHQIYAKSVKKELSKIFETGKFDFKIPEEKIKHVKAFPIAPKLIFPESLFTHSKGWNLEMLKTCESPILKNHACLVSTSSSASLEYTFNGTSIALWFDIQSIGCLEIYLDEKKLGIYTNNLDIKGKFQGRFCSLDDAMNSSISHTLKLVSVSKSKSEPSRIYLRAVAINSIPNKSF